jgi:light-regulated signal transduction histidine kinase (bacteriophytochrome)
VVSIAGIVFGGALIALTSRSAIDRQRALEDYQKLATELEERVRSRTVELETMNRELSAFTYTVSHDLRSPLRTISNFADILNETHRGEFSNEARAHLLRIQKASARMDNLLSGLLNLANITRAKLERSDVDLSLLARTLLADFAAQEPKRAVEIVVADGLHAAGDPTLLTSALQNLLHNAWKFTGKSALARIEFAQERRQGQTIFVVRDTGAGFNMEHIEKLFGMFERLHTAAEFPGHGIGLAVTKRIIERHGGSIWAESALGQGATFFFTLS